MKNDAILVDTTPAKVAIVDGLTRDLSVSAAIQDLVDNAIDSAAAATRAQPATGRGKKRPIPEAPPLSYTGFRIELTLNERVFRIRDNCGGIDAKTFAHSAFRFGKRSSHSYGLGIFGVGLNRALFKLGERIKIATDTGKGFAQLEIRTSEYLAQDDAWQLPANLKKTGPAKGTLIEIEDLASSVKSYFSSAEEKDKLREELSRRYGRLVEKGLVLKVNGKTIQQTVPSIRTDGPYAPLNKSYLTPTSVRVEISSGQHPMHRFAAERDVDSPSDQAPTEEFGWTVYCNDRAVLIANQDHRTGWAGRFHGEYNGFVGVVRFEAADPNLLPWNTTKVDVDLNNAAYQTALADMRIFAAAWRKHAGQAKLAKRRNETLKPRPRATAAAKKAARPAKGASGAGQRGSAPVVRKPGHNESPYLLPADVNELHCKDKLLAVVREGKEMDVGRLTYGGMMLLRVIFETALVHFVDRQGRLGELTDFAAAERSKGGKPVDGADIVASLDEGCKFLLAHQELMGKGKSNHIKHSLTKLIQHKKVLNSCAHNPWQQISWTNAFDIRDEATPILRHLIETGPPT